MEKYRIALIAGAEQPSAMNHLQRSLQELGYDAHVFSLAGFKETDSETTLGSIRPGEWTATLREELDEYYQKNEKFITIGHSLGGIIGAEVAEKLNESSERFVSIHIAICPAFSIYQWATRLHELFVRTGTAKWSINRNITRCLLKILYPGGAFPIHDLYLSNIPPSRYQKAQTILFDYLYVRWANQAIATYLEDRQACWSAFKRLANSKSVALIEAISDEIWEGDVLCPPSPSHIVNSIPDERYYQIPGDHFLPLNLDVNVIVKIISTLS